MSNETDGTVLYEGLSFVKAKHKCCNGKVLCLIEISRTRFRYRGQESFSLVEMALLLLFELLLLGSTQQTRWGYAGYFIGCR